MDLWYILLVTSWFQPLAEDQRFIVHSTVSGLYINILDPIQSFNQQLNGGQTPTFVDDPAMALTGWEPLPRALLRLIPAHKNFGPIDLLLDGHASYAARLQMPQELRWQQKWQSYRLPPSSTRSFAIIHLYCSLGNPTKTYFRRFGLTGLDQQFWIHHFLG